MPMIAMTTSSSTRVNPRREIDRVFIVCLLQNKTIKKDKECASAHKAPTNPLKLAVPRTIGRQKTERAVPTGQPSPARNVSLSYCLKFNLLHSLLSISK
jgi:hypothetical protein